jgi:uncharacterized protein (DUF305 family)
VFANRRRAIIAAVAAAAVLGAGAFLAIQLLAGDGDQAENANTRVVQPGAPGQSGRTLSEQDLASIAPPAHTPADTMFMQRMIGHHAQALEMTALVQGRNQSQDLRLLAERIDVSQRDEIAQMERWLGERGERLPAHDHTAHDQPMPGMLNDEELGRLEGASGVEFDRLFLEFMIRHHQGALTMVEELYRTGGGLESDSDRLAREVNADQSIEIRRMQEMLAKLAG